MDDQLHGRADGCFNGKHPITGARRSVVAASRKQGISKVVGQDAREQWYDPISSASAHYNRTFLPYCPSLEHSTKNPCRMMHYVTPSGVESNQKKGLITTSNLSYDATITGWTAIEPSFLLAHAVAVVSDSSTEGVKRT